MPCKISGHVDVLVDRGGDGTLFVVDSLGKVIYTPVVAEDDEVIQWAIDYVEREFIRQSLENLFDISGEIS